MDEIDWLDYHKLSSLRNFLITGVLRVDDTVKIDSLKRPLILNIMVL